MATKKAATKKLTTDKKTTKVPTKSKVVSAKTTAAKQPVKSTRKATPKKTATPAQTAKPATISPEERYKMIEQAAYFMAEKSGFRTDPKEIWIAAEKEINARLKS